MSMTEIVNEIWRWCQVISLDLSYILTSEIIPRRPSIYLFIFNLRKYLVSISATKVSGRSARFVPETIFVLLLRKGADKGDRQRNWRSDILLKRRPSLPQCLQTLLSLPGFSIVCNLNRLKQIDTNFQRP